MNSWIIVVIISLMKNVSYINSNILVHLLDER